MDARHGANVARGRGAGRCGWSYYSVHPRFPTLLHPLRWMILQDVGEFLKDLVVLQFVCVVTDTCSPSTLTNSFAARSIRSFSEMDGVLQWVGKSLVVLAIQVALVSVTKYNLHR